jgi:hypothetical protein
MASQTTGIHRVTYWTERLEEVLPPLRVPIGENA